jgi:membrane fusion protein, multidrug efflux system
VKGTAPEKNAMEEKQYEELRDEIQRLRDEQQRLRDEQEKLRQDNHSSNGHGPNAGKEKTEDDKNEKEEGKEGQEKSKDRDGNSSQKNDKDGEEKAGQKPPLKERIRTYIQTHRKQVMWGGVGLVAALIIGVTLIIYLSSYESTDDAQIDGHLNAISARIAGTVTGVYVDDDQSVGANYLCVDLDPSDYQTASDQSTANYAQAEAQLRAEDPNVPITETSNVTTISSSGADMAAAEANLKAAEQDYQARLATVRQAQANNIKAQTDLERYRLLVGKGEISRQQFDAVVATAKSQEATVERSQAAASAAQKAIDQANAQLRQAQSKFEEANKNAPRSVAVRRAQLAARQASLLAAKAQADQAALNLSYTKIYAPVAGIIGVKSVEVGQRIQPGEQLFLISQTQDVWITANFKETQLRKMRVGQPVDIHVDAYGKTFHGYVENMPGSTGSVASVLPPENATGNFVKVVQRLPVRIRLNQGEDPQHTLRVGMSVEPKVWLR